MCFIVSGKVKVGNKVLVLCDSADSARETDPDRLTDVPPIDVTQAESRTDDDDCDTTEDNDACDVETDK